MICCKDTPFFKISHAFIEKPSWRHKQMCKTKQRTGTLVSALCAQKGFTGMLFHKNFLGLVVFVLHDVHALLELGEADAADAVDFARLIRERVGCWK